MTVICIGYFDKFSRFFLDIEKHLKINSKTSIHFKIYSIHISGFLYTLFRLKFSSWITLKAWFLVQKKQKTYKRIINSSELFKEISYLNCIQFHKALNSKISKTALKLQALAYIDIFEKRFTIEKPDYLLTLGDSRLCVEIAVAVAKKHNIKVYYIEQGPVNTTFFDDEGANANLSIRNKSALKVQNNAKKYNDKPLNSFAKKYNRSPFYRGMDVLFSILFEKTTICPPDIKFTDVVQRLTKRNKNSAIAFENTSQPIALLVLQVPLDVNMIYHSPHFKSHNEIVKSVYDNLPKSVKLIVREHPLYVNKYDNELYKFINTNHILIDNTTSLNSALKTAKIVIVNNSTVGVEAILNYKTVVVLGNAFYDNNTICLKLENKSELSQILEKAVDYIPNKSKIDTFKDALFNSVLLQGAITDRTLKSSKTIANHLIQNL
ncbi:hypothetical protein HNV10_15040 [Winogradskyella litoriviva]|uniref:Capsular polysaccharide export protein n=1 Tax=Winogradskyella litoriviva TaxID=1220182 RepID=A0ABX2E7S2_9FLAO|nr:hypothetical protein [Winogradskyella litoriviva]NRD24568.1 hypothetical protein [Winogradskyella litoriviva]